MKTGRHRAAYSLGLMILAGCSWIPGTDAAKIDDAKKVIAQELIDPSSPLFRDTYVGSEKPLVVCGEINGKNRLGAYAGFSRFMVAPDTGLHMIENDESARSGEPNHDAALAENVRLFKVSWSLSCAKGAG